LRYLSTVSEIDFAWPKIFVSSFFACPSSLGGTNELKIIPVPAIQWNGMGKRDQDNFVDNVVGHLGLATSDVIKKRQTALFTKVDHELGQRIAQGINVTLS